MQTAEVVVVGAGVVGASIASHLIARGIRDVVILERDRGPGLGSTSKATGGFRAQFGSAINVRLSLLSRTKLRDFEAEHGVDPGYDPRGYLFLAETGEQLAALAAANRIQRENGLEEAQVIGAGEARELSPAAVSSSILGAAFCPTDGFIRPMQILAGYLGSSLGRGLRVDYNRGSVSARRNGNRIDRIVAGSHEIVPGIVINATGAWAGEFSRSCGYELPVRPLRRQVACTVPTDVLPETMPMTIFVSDGFHLRVRDGRVLMLWPDSADHIPEEVVVQNDWLERIAMLQRKHIPLLDDVAIDAANCWAGLYEMSPDDHAILGRCPDIENLYFANGSSGHGVMHSPAIGQLIAELIIDGRASSIDISPLRPERFAEGDLVAATPLL
ncbi:MAG TPA: FAD-dependent oxidoreductase [Thermoanaerobaculia bacterium]|nr:FAD-dependent oxidoreductase [Thermoanaerobaculia bacterium]